MRKQKIWQYWLEKVIYSEDKLLKELNYIFCSDEYLLKINKEYLKHDYFTDVITFDYAVEDVIWGDIFISIDRVKENSKHWETLFSQELKRVMVHGLLHLFGYKDNTSDEKQEIRKLEEEKIQLFHVERFS